MLKKLLEEIETEIKEKGFVVGARVKCKSSSWLSAKGFVEAVEEESLVIRWENEDGQQCYHIPSKATKNLNGEWCIFTTNGMEIIKLWGTH